MDPMASLVRFLTCRKHLLLLAIYPLVGLGFSFCEARVTHAVYLMEWPLVDQMIPFVPWMVWPYVFWYLFVAFPFFWFGWRDGPAFTRYCAFLYGGMVSAYIVYLLFPNGQGLRPALEALGSGWDADILRWLYSHDSPQNVNPSIHVIDTLAVWIALSRDGVLGEKCWFRVVLAGLSLAIIASTVLVKQHSILDVFGGLIWGAVWYGVVYGQRSFSFRFSRS